MRILVTGGAGFIGSNLIHQLLALDGEVMVVDDLSSGHMENLDPRSEFRHLDIRSSEYVQTCQQWQPDVVVHLAAQASVAKSVRNPAETMSVNVEGTRAVARAALQADVERVVFASTAAVYGNPEQLPLAETAPTVPLNPYGQSKLEGEVELATICREGETDFAIARFANVYGPRQDTVGEGGVVSMFCEGLTRGQDLTIHGDGTQTRDFIYVGDVVSALVSMIGGDIWFCQEADVPAAGIYNVATGAATSINDLAIRLQRISGQSVEIKHDAEREGDIRDSVLSPKKAREIFEWKATSELEHSLTNTYRWFSRQG